MITLQARLQLLHQLQKKANRKVTGDKVMNIFKAMADEYVKEFPEVANWKLNLKSNQNRNK